MFKKLEKKWNAHTPVWLHNGTKENFVFQIGTAGVILGVMMYRAHREERALRRDIENNRHLNLVQND